ncbi:MAG: GGDEF domain-containing protein [Gammaproteobacteria bacterium]|jgi:diguanylate cyclase (GGDEF)-like protein
MSDNSNTPYNNILVNRVAIILAIWTTVLIGLRLLAGELHLMATCAGTATAIVFFLIAYLSGKKISATIGAWSLVIILWLGLLFGGYAVGGIHAPVTIVFSLIPLASAYLINIRATIIMCTLSIVSIITFYIIDNLGYSQPITLDNSEVGFFRAAWLICVIFLVSVMGWLYSRKTLQLTKILEEQASTDFLTKLANRRKLNERLEQEFYRTRRHKNWLTLLMIDIDHFKSLNDEEGHVKGDETLVLIANRIKDFCQRSTDIAGRYGGEEFLLILPDLEPDNAKTLAENIRQAVQEISISCSNIENQNLSVTIGCLSVRGTDLDTASELVNNCDKLLYEGKNAGRNIVMSKEICID